jgi:leucyl/phenylalanyl-tRNA--protein transferase
MIDCQMKTAHLASLGGREIPRKEFSQKLKELVNYPKRVEKWYFDHESIE